MQEFKDDYFLIVVQEYNASSYDGPIQIVGVSALIQQPAEDGHSILGVFQTAQIDDSIIVFTINKSTLFWSLGDKTLDM